MYYRDILKELKKINSEMTAEIYDNMVLFIDRMVMFTCADMPVDKSYLKFWEDKRIVKLVGMGAKSTFRYRDGYIELLG